MNFNCYNISICKKGKVKDETSKKICETNGGQWDLQRFHKFSLDVSYLTVTTSAFVKKKSSKMRHLKNRETNGGQIKKQDVPQCFHEFFSMSNL